MVLLHSILDLCRFSKIYSCALAHFFVDSILFPAFLFFSDETVEVGANLYEIDTEALASVGTPTLIPTAATLSPPSIESITAQKEPTPDHRSPSIKFLGKEGWDALRKSHGANKQLLNGGTGDVKVLHLSQKKHAVTTMFDDMTVKDPMYGRPKFSDAEIEALLTGGATLAPQVLSHSTGAKFKL
jgi:hypothetical protein